MRLQGAVGEEQRDRHGRAAGEDPDLAPSLVPQEVLDQPAPGSTG